MAESWLSGLGRTFVRDEGMFAKDEGTFEREEERS